MNEWLWVTWAYTIGGLALYMDYKLGGWFWVNRLKYKLKNLNK